MVAPLAGDRNISTFLWDKCRHFFPKDADLDGVFYSQDMDCECTVPEQGNLL